MLELRGGGEKRRGEGGSVSAVQGSRRTYAGEEGLCHRDK